MADIVLALKPRWLNLILSGKKTVECRRIMPSNLHPGDSVHLYCQGKLHGIAIVQDVQMVDGNDFHDVISTAEIFYEEACLTIDEMGIYLYGGKRPGLIFFSQVFVGEQPIPWKGTAPQNFLYMSTAQKPQQLKLL